MAELVEVIQADREAAADWLNARAIDWRETTWIRDGEADEHSLVQAFARHRIATRPPASAVAEDFSDVRGILRSLRPSHEHGAADKRLNKAITLVLSAMDALASGGRP